MSRFFAERDAKQFLRNFSAEPIAPTGFDALNDADHDAQLREDDRRERAEEERERDARDFEPRGAL